MKIAGILIGVLFLVFAFLQLNDPDSEVWIAAYAFAGVISLLSAFGRHVRFTSLAAFLVFGAWMVTLIPEMKTYSFDSEVFREVLGLSIMAIWMLASGLAHRPRSFISTKSK